MKRILILGVLLLAATGASAQNQYFVSNSGNNANSGTSAGSPWQLISFAISHATLTGGVIINVTPGTYTEAIGGCAGRTASLCANRSGPSTSQRFVIRCTTVGGCLLRNSSVNGGITVVANNVDMTGFDYGNDADAQVGLLAACTPSNLASGNCSTGNSVHFLNNVIHDIGQSVNVGVGLGCPPFGAIYAGSQAHGTAFQNDIQVIGNSVVNYGSFAARPSNGGSCNEGHGIYMNTPNVFIANNTIVQVPTFGIQLYNQACNSVISNNTIDQAGKGGIVIANGACGVGATGRVSINNNIMEAAPSGGISLGTGGGSPCTSTSRVKITNNLLPAGQAITNGNLNGCTDISGTVNETPGTTFTGYSATSASNSYVPKTGSVAAHGGTAAPACASGSTITPCVPASDANSIPWSGNPAIGAFAPAGGGGGSPAPQASPTSLPFSNVLINTDSAVQTSTLTNTGTAAYSITSETISDPNFLFGGVGTCSNGQVIAPGQSCTVSVKFHPLSTGAKSGTLNVGTSATPLVISLTGTGTAPIVSLSPSSLTFASQTLGTTSAIQGVTLTNTGTGALTISAIALAGTNPTQFTQSNTCGASVAAGASCSFSVTFKPTTLGAQSASITITDNATGSPQSIPLTGTGAGTPNPQLSPASLNYSPQLVGTSSSSQPAILTNNGTAPLTINSITTSGDYSQTNNCASPLAVSASCTINVIFTPTAPGSRFGSLVISTNAPGSPSTAALNGSGIQGAIALAPTSLTFAVLNTGSTSAGQVIAISNPGTATVTLSSVALSGANAADFGLVNGCGATLTAGASCNATITFSPSATGSRTASLTVTDSAPGSPHQAPLTGTGTAPVVSLTPSSIPFGNQITGSISSAQNLTLSNTGTGSLTIASIGLTGTNANQFTSTSTCGATLGAGGSCSIAIRFAPTSLGAKSASLTVTDSASGSPHASTLSGTGIAGAPVASLAPSSLTFSATLLGVTSSGQTVTLQNTGTATLTISSIAASGDYSQTNTCGGTLAVAASCAITVRFTPTVAGTRTGNLSVTDNASGSPQTVPLSGTGTPPGGGGSGIAVFSPTSLTFTSQVTNTSSAAQVLTLTNTDTSTMAISTITFAGGNPTDYAQTNNCVPSLGAGASCTVNITFTPLGAGSRPATVVFTDSAASSPQSVPLSGTGVNPFPIVQLTPPALDFGSIQQGSTTASQTVAVKNIGTAILNISGITKTGTNAADYGLTNGCGATLAINATCTLTINFTPSGATTRTAAISIADDAGNTPQTVPMTGVGTPAPAPKVSLSASSLTYAAQQVGTSSGSQSVTVTNIGDGTLNIASILTGPPNATDYTLTNGCAATLAPAASCTLGVVFNPVAPGTRVSTVTVTDDASDSPQSFNLTGTAFTGTPTADLSVSTLIFMSQVVLTTSASQTIALTNNGTASLLITSIVASSDSAPGSNEFARTTNCSGTLPSGASCTINVTFTPQAIGGRTGKVTFTDSAGSSPQIVSLVGTGANPPPPPGSAATGIGGRAGVGGHLGIGVH